MNNQQTVQPQSGQLPQRTARDVDDPKIVDVAADVVSSLRSYARKRPEVVAMWCLGIGFVLGWKLKPW
jgi:hypothetical protein